MKTRNSIIQQPARGVSLCGGQKSITIDGRTFTPDPDTAYVEFQLAHAFPVTTKYRTGIHPQVVANSYRTMVNKVFNLAHIMRKYDVKNNPQDRMLGTVIAVEFPAGPNQITCKCGCTFQWSEQPEAGMGSVKCPDCELTHTQPTWGVQSSRDSAPGIRAVAVMHKAAQWVNEILSSWAAGNTPFNSDGEWTVSMENQHDLEESGFIVKISGAKGPILPGQDGFSKNTPEDLKAMGYIYVPCMTAPIALLECLNNDEDDAREGITSTRVCRDYMGCETILLLNGINGMIRFKGVGLCPAGMEPEAHVKTMLAAEQMFNLDRVAGAFDDVFGDTVRGIKTPQ
jgi:hypothetical protein